MATIDDLTVKFTADVRDLTNGIKRVESKFVDVEKSASRASAKMSQQIGGLGRLFKLDMAIRFGSKLLEVEDRMEQLASTIRDTADRADLGTEALQRLRHAADQNGTSAEAMDSALIRLNKAMGQARSGAAGMGELFQALGLEELIKKGASTEEVFYGISEAVSKMKDESQASALIARIMGREADRLIELMKNGAGDVEALGNALAQVIPEETINKLDAARDKTEELKKIMSVAASIASAAFLDLIKVLGDTVIWLDRQFDLVNKLSGAWKGLSEAASAAFTFSSGPLAESFNQPKNAPAASKFTFGGQGSFADVAGGVRAPVFGPTAASVNVTPNQKQIDNVLAGGTGDGAGKKAADDAARAAQQYSEAVADLSFQLEQLGRSEESAAYFEDLRNNLARAGVSLDSAKGEKIAELTAKIYDQAAAQEAVRKAEEDAAIAGQKWIDMRNQAGDAVASAFERAILEGEKLRDTIGGLLQDLARLIFQKMVFDQISSAISGGLSGIVGGKAGGGTVSPGNSYMVGEGGPEVFVPKVPGNIIPNGRSGGGGVTINSVVHAAPGVNKHELQAVLDQRDAALSKRIPRIMVDKQRRNALGGAFA